MPCQRSAPSWPGVRYPFCSTKVAVVAVLRGEPADRSAVGSSGALDRFAHFRRSDAAAQRRAAPGHALPCARQALFQAIGAPSMQFHLRTAEALTLAVRPLQRGIADIQQQRHRPVPFTRRTPHRYIADAGCCAMPLAVSSTRRPEASTSTMRPLAVVLPSSTMSTIAPRACSSALQRSRQGAKPSAAKRRTSASTSHRQGSDPGLALAGQQSGGQDVRQRSRRLADARTVVLPSAGR